jgi:histidine ammonia-lyase
MINNVAHILGIEWMAAAQGIDFLAPLATSPALQAAHALLREQVPTHSVDRYLAPDIAHAQALVRGGALARILRTLPGVPALWSPA